MKLVYLVQVRMGSSRLPGKPLLKVKDDLTLIESIYQRIAKSRFFKPDNVCFLTSDNSSDDPLVQFFNDQEWHYMRGDEHRVFLRFAQACRELQPDYFFRICSDNPFLDPQLMDDLAESAVSGFDYISHSDQDGNPVIQTHYGFFAELISGHAFRALQERQLDDYMLEHVTPVFYRNRDAYKIKYKPMPGTLVNPDIRLTVDTVTDLEVVKKIFAYLPNNFNIYDVYQICADEPELYAQMASQIKRNRK